MTDQAKQEFTLIIRSVGINKQTGERFWKATTSDILPDSYNDEMSLELYQSFAQRIEAGEAPPAQYCSEAWSGGMPYVSVAHYREHSIAGDTQRVYVDGAMLKANGTFRDTKLGRACFEALLDDLYAPTKRGAQEPVRVSIAFLDFKHRHKASGFVFTRSSVEDVCPECVAERRMRQLSGRVFLDGLLIHFAMTRVPVNKRTLMEVEKSMTTKREDAASIVGAELAEEMDGLEQVTRSEAEVIRSDGAEVERMKNKKDMEDMEDDDHSEDEDHKKDKKHKKTKKQGEDMPMMESMGDSEPMYMPYGGATTFADLKAFLDSNKEQDRVSDIWYAFQVLSRNIWMCEMEDKPAAIAKLADEFKSMVKNKNAVIYESLAQMSLDSEPQPQVQAPDRVAELAAQVAQVDARVTEMLAKIEVLAAPAPAQAKSDHPLADSFTLLRSDFDSVLQMEGDATEKLQAIQPAFNALGEAIRQQLMTEPEIVTPVQKADDRLLALLEKMNDKLDLLNTVNRSTAQVPSTIPAPRSVPPSAIPQLGTAPVQRAAEGPAPKLRALIDKSVGL